MATTAVIDQNIDLPQPATGQIGWATLTAANTAKDGTGTVATILTGATNGSQPHLLKFRPLGTNVATVARVFLNNGGATSTAANNSLFQEVTLPATTLTEVAGQLEYFADLRGLLFLPATYRITVCLATAVAAGWQVTGTAGDM